MNQPLLMPVCVKAYVIIRVAVQHKNRIPEDRGKKKMRTEMMKNEPVPTSRRANK